MDTSTSPTSRTNAPDWSAQTEELYCPLCDYNLRGLIEPRCPECGYQFEWTKLTDPAQRVHPYLFEHHPERNTGSFVQTMIGSLTPWRFWTILHPRQASRPRRLVIYWVLNLLLVLIPSAMMAAPYFVDYYRYTHTNRANFIASVNANPAHRSWVIQSHGSAEAYADMIYPCPFTASAMRRVFSRASAHLPLLTAAIAYLAWPWSGVLLLMIYQQSMKRARIRPAHVLRCLIYSADGTMLFLAGVVPMMVLFGIHFLQNDLLPRTFLVYRWLQNVGMIAVPLVWLGATWRMIVAYRRYLQFPHAAAVVIATEIILFLGLFCTLVLTLHPTELMRMLRLW